MGSIGFNKSSDDIAREWPWLARIRYCDGLFSVEVLIDEESEVGTGTKENRCLSLLVTISWISASVTERAWNLRKASFCNH